MTIHPGGVVQIVDALSRTQTIRSIVTQWATIGLFGAVGWPWLLKSLGDGGAVARQRLLEATGLPDTALPPLGGWRGDAGLLTLIATHIAEARPQVIVEFGGGTTTLIAARALTQAGSGRLISFDSEERFADETRRMLAEQGLEAEIRAAPLVPSPDGWPGLWYAHGPLPDAIDLLIVDGPPWFIHPQVRGAAASLFDRITPGGTVILDDAARPGERLVARRWRREWPDFDFRFVAGPAGTLVGTRRR
ncbi:MAG: class SAM-dependent methyltransferase [Sphingomonas bacterium]|nr:class SAM-dependent methyltransferase [Sphingomonas bacterium]MDB5719237.1 class SAM-dependent methyltransferase [Sphingomonas bacterium]